MQEHWLLAHIHQSRHCYANIRKWSAKYTTAAGDRCWRASSVQQLYMPRLGALGRAQATATSAHIAKTKCMMCGKATPCRLHFFGPSKIMQVILSRVCAVSVALRQTSQYSFEKQDRKHRPAGQADFETSAVFLATKHSCLTAVKG